MSGILYKNQHQLNQKPIYNPIAFKSMLEAAASINNKYVNRLKADIGSYLQTAGTLASSIDTFNNLGFSVIRKTVNWQKLIISNKYQESVNNYYSYENRMKSLIVHNYDGHIQYHQELRSMINSKLIDFILYSLHSTVQTTKNYIEYTNLLFKIFERLKNNVNIRRAITLRNDKGAESKIPLEILSLIPIIGPLHISLNKNTQQINKKKFPNFSLPIFNINVNVKVLPLVWNTETKPFDNKFCDAEKCLLSNNSNNPLFNNNINISSLKKRLFTLLKDNEKPLAEDKNNSNLNEDIDNDEDIENILKRIESNIDN
ncbi:hypothetical protein RhiirA4_481822 [Rhizophagus irregularis]|uniref:Uncharacterized protein n=1 Tax=Rhizophagus irregularis TaxID=588596 RepID=A0A2I1HK41_9GLOM|nr:hypothetical protein RhiirA4_481822 [Rhizophagus irregularis]